MRILVTGGCGFIGSNFVRLLLEKQPDTQVRVLDLLTYAGNLENLADVANVPRFEFIRGDIANATVVTEATEGVDAVVNFAAESHVDRSILDDAPFIRTNILGTQVLLNVALERGIARFVQISTDEVYGSLGPLGKFTEQSPLAPNSPYSASKASADLLVRAYVKTHNLPAIIIRSSNAYGPYQFIEKLIPLMISNAFEGKPLPVYGDGMQVRDWIYVTDCCTAILHVLERGETGEVYNVGGGNERTNLTMVKTLLRLTGAPESLIRFVPDRPGHDRRYAMDHSKLTAALGWAPAIELELGLSRTVEWYSNNKAWVESQRTGRYMKYYEQQYGARLTEGDLGHGRE